jgi:hypothetical protein
MLITPLTSRAAMAVTNSLVKNLESKSQSFRDATFVKKRRENCPVFVSPCGSIHGTSALVVP